MLETIRSLQCGQFPLNRMEIERLIESSTMLLVFHGVVLLCGLICVGSVQQPLQALVRTDTQDHTMTNASSLRTKLSGAVS